MSIWAISLLVVISGSLANAAPFDINDGEITGKFTHTKGQKNKSIETPISTTSF